MKEQLRKNSPFMVISLLAYTMFIILPTLLPGGRTLSRAQGMLDLLSMQNPVMLVMTVIVPFAVAMLMFSYLFNSRAMSAYHNFTDNKNQLFWTNMVTGLILIIVPLLITSLFLLIRVRVPVEAAMLEYPADLFSRGFTGNNVINTFPVIMSFFMRILISFVFFYGLWLLAFSLCGKWVISLLIFGAVPLIPVLFHKLFIMIGSTYVFGYHPNNVTSAETIISYTNPLAWFWSFGERANQPVFYLIYTVIAILLIGIANGCFISRKIEKAEDTIVFTSFKNIFIFFLSIVGMVAMGGFMTSILTGRWFLYYGFVIGFALTFCLAQMIFEKNFNIIKKVKWLLPSVGIVAGLYGIMLLITMFGMRSYTHYVPNANQVSGVYVSQEGFWQSGDEFITDSAVIENIIAIHRDITRTVNFRSNLTRDERKDMRRQDIRDFNDEQKDNRKDLNNAFWQSITGGGSQFRENGGEYIYITYLLNNGDRVERRYALSGNYIKRHELDIPLLVTS
jgi:ABC-2 type transport system permease protein